MSLLGMRTAFRALLIRGNLLVVAACVAPAHSQPDAGGVADAAAGDGATDAAPEVPADAAPLPVTISDPDGTGTGATRFADGAPDPAGVFFTPLGSNGRSCSTCHDRTTGWTVTPAALQTRFDATGGTDPIFRLIDGAVSPNADVSTVAARQVAYAELLTKGLIRVTMTVPAGAEFTVSAVADPYGYASATELSLFRRIPPATNLGFEVTLMWDGREPSLAHQAMDATLGHAQATMVTPAQVNTIVALESSLSTAQLVDTAAGPLDAVCAQGGPQAVAVQPFHAGINDPFGRDPLHGAYTADVFTEYSPWSAGTAAQQSIARGEALFDTRTFAVINVAGIPDQPKATCSTCHDTPGTGGHSIDETMAIDPEPSNGPPADLPMYTLRRASDGTTVQLNDPGRALVTGKWADVGKFKVPGLRGLAMRAPYFHNGSASSLADVVGFYNQKFSIGLSAQEQLDLANFLAAL